MTSLPGPIQGEGTPKWTPLSVDGPLAEHSSGSAERSESGDSSILELREKLARDKASRQAGGPSVQEEGVTADLADR